jgi:hypothetical protein
MDREMLLIDTCLGNGFFLDLKEATERGLTKFRGKFQEAEAESTRTKGSTRSACSTRTSSG